MLQSPFKSMLARSAIFALVLALAISFVSLGLAQPAAAQQADEPSCEANKAGDEFTCTYDENDDVPVADFSAPDPEGQGVEWDLNGDDASDFEIDADGVLTFKNSPNHEAKSTYVVTVRATEVLGPGDSGPAQYTDVKVTVNINDLDEPGTIAFTYKQPEEGAPWEAMLSDQDREDGDAQTWQWSVPKVERPALDNDQHWTDAKGANATSSTYTPLITAADPDNLQTNEAAVGDKDKILRAKVTYTDAHGDEQVAYARTDVPVRAVNAGRTVANTAPTFSASVANTRTVNENAKKGQHVGNPVTADGDEDLSLLTYTLTDPSDPDLFEIDGKTGQIKVLSATLQADPSTTPVTVAVEVTARDPSGLSSSAFTVTITVREVDEKPVVRQFDNGTGAALVDTNMEISTVCIEENRPLAIEDNDATEDVDESRFDNVVTNNNACDNDPAVDYVFTARDDDIADGDRVVISGTARPDENQVKLSLTGDDAALFELVEVDSTGIDRASDGPATGNWELRFSTSEADFESPTDANRDNRYELTVMAEDEDGLTSMKDLTVKIVNRAEGGKVEILTSQPAVGFAVMARLTDPDTGETGVKWQWLRAATRDGTFVNIPGATSDTYTPKGATEDDPATTLVDEEDPGDEGRFLKVMVTYTDDAMDDTVTVEAISANAVRVEPDVNANPVFDAGITREVPENTKEGGTVGGPVTASDPDDDIPTYSITGGADMDAFTIESATGQIKVGKGTMLNYESGKRTYEVEVTATDPFNGQGSTTVTIMVTDVNEKPGVSLGTGTTPPSEGVVGGDANPSVPENTTAVGTYTTTIQNPSSWTLSGEDMGSFTISGGVLSFRSAPDFENPGSANGDNVYMVTVMANNGNGGASLDVTVTVTNDPSDDATGFDPNTYDANGDGSIDKDEVLDAIDDYFDNEITKEQVLDVIDLYFN